MSLKVIRMKRTFNAFLFDRIDAPLLDGTGLQPDPELAARNLARARELIKQMGPKWICYSAQANRDGEEELMMSAQSHTGEL